MRWTPRSRFAWFQKVQEQTEASESRPWSCETQPMGLMKPKNIGPIGFIG